MTDEQTDDRTLIYMLFDAVIRLSERVMPGWELRLVPGDADAPHWNDGKPLGMFDVYWTREFESPFVENAGALHAASLVATLRAAPIAPDGRKHVSSETLDQAGAAIENLRHALIRIKATTVEKGNADSLEEVLGQIGTIAETALAV
jgi:hypothetical protein